MTLEQELVALVQRYLASQVSFEELAAWEHDHETDLLELGPQSIAGQLAGAISITGWEIRNGDRPKDSARSTGRGLR
jgi:hypothetical protein